MSIYYDKLDSYSDYLVMISCGFAGISLKGLIDDEEFSYSNGASWGNSTVASAGEGLIRGAASKFATKIFGSGVGNAVSQNLKTLLSTFQGYEGDSGVSFSLNMHFFPNKYGNGSYNNMELQLAKLTQPNVDGMTDILKSYLYSPKDTAKIALGSDPFKNQLVHCSIGDWFMATGLKVDNVSRSYSKYVDDKGAPLYMSVSITFSPYKSLNATELSDWIKR